jgi:hypothetical protein
MAPRLRSASALHNALPEPVLRVIMLALPADARARAACVCRSWRAFVADPSLWLQLDLTPAGGVAAERVTENLARGAVARAAGHLRVLSLCYGALRALNVLAVIESNGAELQQVNTMDTLSVEQLAAVLAAAPRLQVLNARVAGECTELLPVVRNDPPFGPLRVRELGVFVAGEDPKATDVLALAAALATHVALDSLFLMDVNFSAGLNALVDAAAERRVSSLTLRRGCIMDADSLPALARLLQRSSLTTLVVTSPGFPHAQQASMPVFCAALRACRTLVYLGLQLRLPDGASLLVVTELLGAVATLPALTMLELTGSHVQDTAAFGYLLGALLAANRPNLRILHVDECRLGDEGMAPLLDGLATNTHLCKLDCRGNNLSEVFDRDRLAPALAALEARAELDA